MKTGYLVIFVSLMKFLYTNHFMILNELVCSLFFKPKCIDNYQVNFEDKLLICLMAMNVGMLCAEYLLAPSYPIMMNCCILLLHEGIDRLHNKHLLSTQQNFLSKLEQGIELHQFLLLLVKHD